MGLRKPDEAMIRVVIADDVALFRRQLLVALEQAPDIEVMAEATDTGTLLAQAQELAPDVVVVGMQLPSIGAVRVAAALRELVPGTAVIVLAAADDESEVVRAVKAGAAGFLARDSAANQGVAATRTVARGRAALSAPVAEAVLAEYASLERQIGSVQQQLDPPRLETAEERLLGRVAAGSSLAEVAAELGMASFTAQNLLANSLQKLHRHARTEAVMYGLGSRLSETG